jgi:hypothetical protein
MGKGRGRVEAREKRGEKGGVREGGREERRRGGAEEAAVVLTSLKGQWCTSFWPEFFASNSSFGSHEAQMKTALNI